jgi:hypothetical protein
VGSGASGVGLAGSDAASMKWYCLPAVILNLYATRVNEIGRARSGSATGATMEATGAAGSTLMGRIARIRAQDARRDRR